MNTSKLKESIINGIDEVMNKLHSRFQSRSGREMARQYITGLMSTAERKNGWQLSEAMGQKTPYAIQQFIYRGNWNADEVRDELREYAKEKLGEESGVLIADETGFIKKGKKSAGVMRQYSGTAGRIENSQIGVFITYASSKGHMIIDRELYLPKEWMDDSERCKEAGIPEETQFKTKPQMALEMLKSAHDASVPFSWVTADSIYGDFRDIGMWLESISKGYVMAVSGKAYIWQGFTQHRVSKILEALPAAEADSPVSPGWERLSAGSGSKGERMYDWMLIPANDPPAKGWKRDILVRRSISKPDDIRAFICYYPEGMSVMELAAIAGIRWRIEQSFEEAKGEVGLDHYEVRSYGGWYKHITLSCWALALLTALKVDATKPEFQKSIAVDSTKSMDAFKRGRGLSDF